MKLCIPSCDAKGLESTIEPHFPHASHLCVFDTESRQHAVFAIDSDTDAQIDAVLCASINRMTLRHLLDQGIEVYGTAAERVVDAIAQFERGELHAVRAAPGCGQHGQDHAHCGGGDHHATEHECCGGHGHQDADHECCGGQEHAHGGCGRH